MTRTLENKCEGGNHKLLRFIGTQKGVGTLNNLVYCYYCNVRATITDKYRKVLKDAYELRPGS